MPAWTYMMASKKDGVIYIGVTTDLAERAWQHQNDRGSSFCARYHCRRLVWFEEFFDVRDAIVLEKRMKAWKREWKIREIEARNPEWADQSAELVGGRFGRR